MGIVVRLPSWAGERDLSGWRALKVHRSWVAAAIVGACTALTYAAAIMLVSLGEHVGTETLDVNVGVGAAVTLVFSASAWRVQNQRRLDAAKPDPPWPDYQRSRDARTDERR
jgi:hypothetical protein